MERPGDITESQMDLLCPIIEVEVQELNQCRSSGETVYTITKVQNPMLYL